MENSWQTKKLGEICTLVKGKKPKSFSDTGKAYLTARVIRALEEAQYTEEEDGVVCVDPEEILIIMDGSNSGEMFTGLSGIVASTMGIVKCSKEMLRVRFLLYFLNMNREDFTKSRTGSAIPHLNKEEFENCEIPLPPLPEQKRIVKILDEVFEKIEKAKENTKQNLDNSKELFEAVLEETFKDIKSDKKSLGDICKVIGGGTPSKESTNFTKFYNGTIPWATVRDMKSDIIKKTQHYITEEAVKRSSTNIIPKNNIVIATRVGLGKVCLIEKDTAINQDLRGIIPFDNDEVFVSYLFWWLKSISKIIIENGTGATVHGVKLPFVKGLKVSMLSLREQQKIVKKLDALSAQTKKLEKIYQQKLDDLEELKKSVLKSAFAGEL